MLKRSLLASACLCTLAAATAVCSPTSKPSDQPAAGKKKGTYFHIRIEGGIGRDFTAHRMESLLKQATEAKPDVVLLDINTPGGTIDDAEKIIDLIIRHKDLRFVAFVRKALSAGAAIALACPEIYMSDTATIGAATSYSVSSEGRIVELPADIEEKMQSVWRAACRKAAEHGRHSSLIAEAMADRDFKLTMRKENGKVVLERDGQGKTLAAKGRLLTLTGKEAVDCQLAKGLVTDLDGLRTSLNMQPCGAAIQQQNEAKPFYDELGEMMKQFHLGPEYKSLTGLQKQDAREKVGKWFGERKKFLCKRVYWTITLIEAGRNSVLATPADNPKIVIVAFVNRSCADYLSKKDKGDQLLISGTIDAASVTGLRYHSGTWWASRKPGSHYDVLGEMTRGLRLRGRYKNIRPQQKSSWWYQRVRAAWPGHVPMIVLGNCEAGEKVERELSRIRSKPAKPETKVETAQQKAARQLRIAKMYLAAGKKGRVVSILKSILADYPDTEAAKVARQELEKLSPKDK